jgi:hypothetical protein
MCELFKLEVGVEVRLCPCLGLPVLWSGHVGIHALYVLSTGGLLNLDSIARNGGKLMEDVK